jgi:GTP-binding protein
MQRITFIKSAKVPKDYPPGSLPEVAITGRSNAGKSSLINIMARAKNVAKVSSSPGKTRLLNFFDYDGKFRLVDMPGYGFSKRSGHEQHSWEEMVETYLHNREQLRGLLLVMDIRRDWDENEQILLDWANKHGFEMAVVLTKSDKLSRGAALNKVKEIQKLTGLQPVFAVSALKKEGHEAVESHIFNAWVN